MGQVYSSTQTGDNYKELISRYYDLAEEETRKPDFSSTEVKSYILFGRANLLIPYEDEDLFAFSALQPPRVDSLKQAIENGTTPTTPYTQTFTITVILADFDGLVTISGDAVFGEMLTAVTADLTSNPVIPDLGALSYQWKRDDVNTGDNSATYTIVEADIAHTMTVTVTAANCNGDVTSAATTTITKAPQEAPPPPTAANITSESITLNVMAGCEYRIIGGEWQSSPVFGNLVPKTTYSFEAYKPETTTHFASPPSPIAEITTEESSNKPEIISIEISPKSATVPPGQDQYFTVTVTAVGDADDSVIWSVAGNFSTLTAITPDGLLSVGANETAETVIVKVTSVFDPTMSDEATVTISNVGIVETGRPPVCTGVSESDERGVDDMRYAMCDMRRCNI